MPQLSEPPGQNCTRGSQRFAVLDIAKLHRGHCEIASPALPTSSTGGGANGETPRLSKNCRRREMGELECRKDNADQAC